LVAGRVFVAAGFAVAVAVRFATAGFAAAGFAVALVTGLVVSFPVALFVARVLLVARLAGAEPLADLTAEERFAGVLVAVRFTGSSVVAGLAFVAATYTLSVYCRPTVGATRGARGGVPHRKVCYVEFRR
jgi:hypothetical protein